MIFLCENSIHKVQLGEFHSCSLSTDFPRCALILDHSIPREWSELHSPNFRFFCKVYIHRVHSIYHSASKYFYLHNLGFLNFLRLGSRASGWWEDSFNGHRSSDSGPGSGDMLDAVQTRGCHHLSVFGRIIFEYIAVHVCSVDLCHLYWVSSSSSFAFFEGRDDTPVEDYCYNG